MRRTVLLAILCLMMATTVNAQDGSAEAEVDIEGGDTEYSAQTSLKRSTSSGGGGGGSTRIGIQARLPLLALALRDGRGGGNNFGFGGGGFDATSMFMPMIAPGVRFLDGDLYLGLGLGFTHYSDDDDGNGADEERSAWSLSPLASYDILSDDVAALSLGGVINFISVGETERSNCNGNCNDNNDDGSALGITLGMGIRASISEGLSIGGDFGWGILSMSWDANNHDYVVHGLVGSLMFEATVGI